MRNPKNRIRRLLTQLIDKPWGSLFCRSLQKSRWKGAWLSGWSGGNPDESCRVSWQTERPCSLPLSLELPPDEERGPGDKRNFTATQLLPPARPDPGGKGLAHLGATTGVPVAGLLLLLTPCPRRGERIGAAHFVDADFFFFFGRGAKLTSLPHLSKSRQRNAKTKWLSHLKIRWGRHLESRQCRLGHPRTQLALLLIPAPPPS